MKIYDLVLPDHFCPQPFTYLYAGHLLSLKPCCKSDVYKDKSNITFDEWWYEDEDLRELRDALLKKEVTPIIDDVCAPCRSQESSGIVSYRQNALEAFKNNSAEYALSKIIDSYKKTKFPMLPAGQRLFHLKVRGFGNECNLRCYMCYPVNSSSRVSEMRKAEPESINIFFRSNKNPHDQLEKARKLVLNIEAEKSRVYEAIESVSSNISQLNFAGGEPVMIEEYYNLMDKFIDSGDAQDVSIFMSSNLSKLGFKDKSILDYINKFKNFSIDASIDDLFERDEWIRYPSNFDDVIKNYNILKQHESVNMSVNITWSILNISNAENILNFFEDNNMTVNSNLNLVNSPIELNVKNYPFKEELIERYSKSNNKMLNDLAKALSTDFNKEEFNRAIKYIKNLDKLRNTKSYEVFPELTQFLT